MPAARSPGRAYSPTAARNPGQLRRFAVRCSLPLRSDLHLAPRQALPPLPPTTPKKGNSRAAYPCESPFMLVLNRLTCSLLSRPRESARMNSLGDVRVRRDLVLPWASRKGPLSGRADVPARGWEREILTHRGHRRYALGWGNRSSIGPSANVRASSSTSLRLRAVINDSAWASGADGVCLWGFV